jgi:hypothetical protein
MDELLVGGLDAVRNVDFPTGGAFQVSNHIGRYVQPFQPLLGYSGPRKSDSGLS